MISTDTILVLDEEGVPLRQDSLLWPGMVAYGRYLRLHIQGFHRAQASLHAVYAEKVEVPLGSVWDTGVRRVVLEDVSMSPPTAWERTGTLEEVFLCEMAQAVADGDVQGRAREHFARILFIRAFLNNPEFEGWVTTRFPEWAALQAKVGR